MAKSITGLPIRSLQDGTKLGEISELVIDPLNGKLLALLVNQKFLGGPKIISLKEIRQAGTSMIIVDSSYSIAEPDEIIRVKEVLDQKIRIIENNVVTESGQKLGKVKDYSVDLKGERLAKIYVGATLLKELFKEELIIPYENIISITKEKIIVSDTYIKNLELGKVKGTVPATG